MIISEEILSILVCPESKNPLELASDSVTQSLNKLILNSSVVNKEGRMVNAECESFLITKDGVTAYPIRDGIPVLLIEEGITIDKFDL
jgi:uncharacterized protein YbaR (Trm112 family)